MWIRIIQSWVKVISSNESLVRNLTQWLKCDLESYLRDTKSKLKSNNYSGCKFKRKWQTEWQWKIK